MSWELSNFYVTVRHIQCISTIVKSSKELVFGEHTCYIVLLCSTVVCFWKTKKESLTLEVKRLFLVKLK
ncbi:hypothetical protein ACF0H5_023990 [Mactra antiquata]